jgi:hypothetical protein
MYVLPHSGHLENIKQATACAADKKVHANVPPIFRQAPGFMRDRISISP